MTYLIKAVRPGSHTHPNKLICAAVLFLLSLSALLQTARADAELCASAVYSWHKYYPVYAQQGEYYQCSEDGADAPLEAPGDLSAHMAAFDEARHQADHETLRVQLQYLSESYVSSPASLRGDLAVRIVLGHFLLLKNATSLEKAVQFIQTGEARGTTNGTTIRLLALQNAFIEQNAARTDALCTEFSSSAYPFNAAQKALFYGTCGFQSVIHGNQARRNDGYAQLVDARDLLPQNPMLCAHIYNGLATFHLFSNDNRGAANALESGLQCLNNAQALHEQDMQDDLTNNLALIYRQQDNLPGYLSMLRASAYQHAYRSSPSQLLVSYMNLGRAYMLVGDWPKSERYYQKALRVSENNSLTVYRADNIIALARHRLADDDVEKAQAYLRQLNDFTLSPFQKAKSDAMLMQIRVQQSPALFSESEYQTQLAFTDSELSEKQRLNIYADWLAVLHQAEYPALAEALVSRMESYDSYPLSVTIAIANSKLLTMAAQQRNNQARISRSDVEQVFEPAFTAIIQAGEQFESQEVGMSWLSQSRTFINNYLSFLLPSENESELEKAVMVSERFASIVFNRHRAAVKENNESSALALKSDALWAEWAVAETAGSEGAQQGFDSFSAKRDAAWERAQLAKSIQSAGSVSGATHFSEIRGMLGQGSVMLKIFALQNKNCALIITNADIRQHCTQGTEPLNRWMTDALINDEHVTQVYILPDGPWRNVAFAALTNKADSRYLGQQMSLIRILSLPDYVERNNQRHDHGGIVSFTNPSNPSAQMVADNAWLKWRAGFPPLPWTAQANSVFKEAFPDVKVTMFTENDASKSNLVSPAAREASLLHVGSHAFYSLANPDMQGLLTSVDTEDPAGGFISYEHLFAHPFSNQLVVISACETEMGRLYQGIGMRSLSHGFLYQGAGATISTLWKVPDRATAEFMRYFYAYLANNEGNIAPAMLHARRKLAAHRRFRDPKYWAGFVFTTTSPDYEQLVL